MILQIAALMLHFSSTRPSATASNLWPALDVLPSYHAGIRQPAKANNVLCEAPCRMTI
jgi:hypothetical protein